MSALPQEFESHSDIPVVLVVDDDAKVRSALRRDVMLMGEYRVLEAANGSEALEQLGHDRVAVALVDMRMPGMSGLDVVRWGREQTPHTDFVVVTGDGDMGTATACLDAGASDFLEKPIHVARLRSVLQRSVELADLRRAQRDPGADDVDDFLFGTSPQMVKVREDIRRYGPSDAPVLIQGESGSGKDLVARALHAVSGRTGRYVPVNCVAIAESLFEGELFGWEKGAHNMAVTRREGKLGSAAEGTLLLDEIGDMPLDFQAKLLRAVESGAYDPVGGDTPRPMTARIVAATHWNLKMLVDEGRFRKDLRWRLEVITIHLPPLRERAGDIGPLTRRFVHEFNGREKRDVQKIAPETLALLEGYAWPGNVRELRNVLQRAVLEADGDTLTPDLVRKAVGQPLEVASKQVAALQPLDEGLFELPYNDAKKEAERRFVQAYLREHLRRADFVVARAAESAGMAAPNFHRLMKRHHVSGDS